MAYLAFLYFCGLNLALKPREVINPFPDLYNFPFDSEYVMFILFRLSKFDDMSKVTYLSLPLIYLCFLTLWRPKVFMFTARNKFNEISDGIPCLFYFCGLTLALKPREVINPFPDLSNFTFESEDVMFILSRLSNFDDMSKVTYLPLPLIYLCFLTLWRPKVFMFTARKKISLPVNFPSQNVFWLEQPG